MSLPSNIFATAFRQQQLGLFFMAIMAIMVYVATVAMAAQVTLSFTTSSWDHDLRDTLTIELPSHADATPPSQADVTKQILDALHGIPELIKIEKLPDADEARLLQPWIKDDALFRTLPLPVLIDVQTAQGQTITAETLQQKLSLIAKDVRVESHAEWQARLLSIIQSITLFTWILMALTLACLIVIISLICRLAMAVQHDTLELLHLLGATDGDIARQFQNHVRRLSWPASAIGFILAIVSIGGFATILYRADLFSSSPHMALLLPALTIFLVPMAAILCTTLTARFSVLRLLRQMP